MHPVYDRSLQNGWGGGPPSVQVGSTTSPSSERARFPLPPRKHMSRIHGKYSWPSLSPSLSLSQSLMAAPALVVLLLLVFAFFGGSDAATWCVCRSDASATALQKALDFACGAGADCNPVLQAGACYAPNTVIAHCSYAANSYFQRKGQAAGACDFAGAAAVTNSDPSYSGCSYPSTASAAGTGGTTTTTTGSSSSTFTPTTTGVLGPSGSTMSTDASGSPGAVSLCSLTAATVLSCLLLLGPAGW